MTQQYSWPISEVTVALPAGWHVKQSWTLLAPDRQANVIASCEPVSEGMTTDEYAHLQGSLLQREFPGYTQLSFDRVDVGPVPALLRDFQWTPPDGLTVRQLQLYLVLSGRGYTATATAPVTRFPQLEQIFRGTLTRMRFGPWAIASPA